MPRPTACIFGLMLATCMAMVGCNFADALVLWPPSGPVEAGGATRRVVGAAGKEVEIWSASAGGEAPDAFVLRFYGNADRAEWHVAEEASRYPRIELWGVNYPGFGGSTGPATLRGAAAAALAAYDALAARAGGKPIFAFGTSLGTTAALHVARNRSVRGLLLVNPPPLRELVLGEYGWWNLWLAATWTAAQIPPELDSVQNARSCGVPAVFVTAERDEIVPPAYQRRVFAAYAGPKEVIVLPGGTHNSGAEPEQEREIALAVERLFHTPVSGTSTEWTGDSFPPRRSRILP